MDYQCLQIINEERKKHGIQPVANAKHIQTAADLGLGTMKSGRNAGDPSEYEAVCRSWRD